MLKGTFIIHYRFIFYVSRVLNWIDKRLPSLYKNMRNILGLQ